MSSIADMLTGVASSLRTVLTSINTSLAGKDVQEAETLSDVPDQIASISTGILTAMDGGQTTVDGSITVQSEDGTSLSYQDQSFRGEDVVGCWIEKKIIGSELFKIYAMLILPTEKTALGGVRLIAIYHDAVMNVCATTRGVYASGYSFTVTEHGIAVSLPSDASEKFIADADYLIYPIRGNGRS